MLLLRMQPLVDRKMLTIRKEVNKLTAICCHCNILTKYWRQQGLSGGREGAGGKYLRRLCNLITAVKASHQVHTCIIVPGTVLREPKKCPPLDQ